MFHSGGTVQSKAEVPLGTSKIVSPGNSRRRISSVWRTPLPVMLRQIGKSSVARSCIAWPGFRLKSARALPVSIESILAPVRERSMSVPRQVQGRGQGRPSDGLFRRAGESPRVRQRQSGVLDIHHARHCLDRAADRTGNGESTLDGDIGLPAEIGEVQGNLHPALALPGPVEDLLDARNRSRIAQEDLEA